MVESLSGHLAAMLNARQLDLAVLFDSRLYGEGAGPAGRRWQIQPLIEEDLFLIRAGRRPGGPACRARCV
jgi:LysR family tcuABC transcriptional regulator